MTQNILTLQYYRNTIHLKETIGLASKADLADDVKAIRTVEALKVDERNGIITVERFNLIELRTVVFWSDIVRRNLAVTTGKIG